MRALPLITALACSGGPTTPSTPTGDTSSSTTTTEPQPEPCGRGERFDMVVRGTVVDENDNGVVGATVDFVERNWRPGIYGTAVTGPYGRFEVQGTDMPLLFERCWGIGVQFWLEMETETHIGDSPLNAHLLDALAIEADEVNLQFPVFVQPRP